MCKHHSSHGFCKLVWNPAPNSNTNILSKQPFFLYWQNITKSRNSKFKFPKWSNFGGNNLIAIYVMGKKKIVKMSRFRYLVKSVYSQKYKNIWLKICISYLLYTNFWQNLSKDDHHFFLNIFLCIIAILAIDIFHLNFTLSKFQGFVEKLVTQALKNNKSSQNCTEIS